MDVGTGVPTPPAKEKPPLTVVGDVGGRIAIMVVSSNRKLPGYTKYLLCILVKLEYAQFQIK
jgi:hypothetical protein